MRVAFLGLGNMGTPMALNVLSRGHELTVFNRTQTKTRPLLEAGAKVAPTAAEAVEPLLFGAGTAEHLSCSSDRSVSGSFERLNVSRLTKHFVDLADMQFLQLDVFSSKFFE